MFFLGPQSAKSKVQKVFDGTITGHFRRYYESALFDKLAKACIYHFLARFEHDALSKVSSPPIELTTPARSHAGKHCLDKS